MLELTFYKLGMLFEIHRILTIIIAKSIKTVQFRYICRFLLRTISRKMTN
jgi:hypothetical protein